FPPIPERKTTTNRKATDVVNHQKVTEMTINENEGTMQAHLVPVSVFPNLGGKSFETYDYTLPELADAIRSENRIRKELLPLLVLGEFGEERSKKGSLR